MISGHQRQTHVEVLFSPRCGTLMVMGHSPQSNLQAVTAAPMTGSLVRLTPFAGSSPNYRKDAGDAVGELSRPDSGQQKALFFEFEVDQIVTCRPGHTDAVRLFVRSNPLVESRATPKTNAPRNA